jgi:glycosyltransferase involved in cell wall biosynthesis
MIRVLLVSHTAMSRTAGQPRLDALSAYDDIELTALVPDRMNFYGTWETAEPPENPNYRFEIGRARWQNIRGQWYLQHYPSTLKKLIRELQPDILDLWHEPWSLVSAQAIWSARRYSPRTKILVETEQNIYKRLPFPFSWFQNYSLRNADYLVGRNAESLEVARRKGWQGKCSVVPNAVDCNLFRPMFDFRSDNTYRVGYVGRLVPEKGVQDLIEAFSRLDGGAELHIVGDGAMRPELEALAAKLGCADDVKFWGNQPYAYLPQFMAGLDVLVLPSHTTERWKEQFGRVLIEAGACEVPVIGSDSGAIPDVVGDAGLIFPEGERDALTDALLFVRDHHEERGRMGRRGRERALSLFAWQQTAAMMYEIYQDMMKTETGS